MSFEVPIDDFSLEEKKEIQTLCNIVCKGSKYVQESKIVCYRIDEESDRIFLPLGLWSKFLHAFPEPYSRPVEIKVSFTGTLLTRDTDEKKRDQDVIVRESMEILKRDHVLFLSLATSTGKTCIATYLTAKLGYKTVWLCFLDRVNTQTVGEYQRFTNAKVQLIETSKEGLDPDADVYIIGLRKAHSMWVKNERVFDSIGTVIVDEAHLCSSFVFSKLLLVFTPYFLIGMSATPDKALEGVMNLYFGKNVIVRRERKCFVVKKLSTKFQPDMSKKITIKTKRGKFEKVPDWTHAMSSLSFNQERNDFIVQQIIDHLEGHKIILLCDRKEQCRYIAETLENLGVDVDTLYGTKKSFREECHVLVGGEKKIGVGFNDPSRNLLILACSLSDVRQSEGRIRTTNNLIIDIVDDSYALRNRWYARRKWYLTRGAVIEGETSKDMTSISEESPEKPKSPRGSTQRFLPVRK